MATDSGYMVAVYILVPALIVGGLCLLLYICCSKRYRLNWFERTLLEAHEERSSEKEYINTAATRGSTSTGAGTSVGDHGMLSFCISTFLDLSIKGIVDMWSSRMRMDR